MSVAKPLWQFSAVELAAAYRTGDATPVEALSSVMARIDAVNPRLNAIVTLDPGGADAAAWQSTTRWRAGAPRGPLDGVPLTVKDNILTRGLRSTWGSRLYADHVPLADEEPVARLRDAGAVILGKTNVPEFTLHGYTDNLLFGPTRNPWNLDLTPGGSSGGGVAAVAAGLGPLALCTDGGGSIRRPAAHTGLVGFKPSRGMVPRDGFPAILHDFEVAGPVARSAGDVALVMAAIAGANWPAAPPESHGSLRILFIPRFGGAPVDPAIASAVASVASALRERGHAVQTPPGDFTLADPLGEIWPVISQAGLAWLMSRHDRFEDRVGPAIAAMAKAGAAYSAADYVGALQAVETMKAGFDGLFQRFDLLLTPATAAMPWPAAEPHPPTIDGTPVGPRGHAIFTPFANALGLPAITLPCEPTPDGMPIGIQLVAAAGRDAFLVAFAQRCETELGLTCRRPPL